VLPAANVAESTGVCIVTDGPVVAPVGSLFAVVRLATEGSSRIVACEVDDEPSDARERVVPLSDAVTSPVNEPLRRAALVPVYVVGVGDAATARARRTATAVV
jgi:hypothetical protein